METSIEKNNLASSLPVLIWMAGTDMGCFYFNETWLNFTGKPLSLEQGNGWADGVHPDDLERCISIYKLSFEKREKFVMEYRLLRHDGVYRWLIDYGIPDYDDHGIFKGYVGTCIDITEKKDLEVSLKRSEQKFENLFRDHTAVMLLTDPLNGDIIDANKAALQFYGYSYEQLCATSIFKINVVSAAVILPGSGKQKTEDNEDIVFQHRLSNNEIREVKVNSSSIVYDDKTVLFSIIQDVTHSNEIERQLQLENSNKDALMNTTTDYFFSVDRNFNLTAANKSYLDINAPLARNHPFKVGDNVFDDLDFSPDEKAKLFSYYNRAFEGESFTIENYHLLNKYNLDLWCDITYHPVYRNNQVSGVAVYSKDINERKNLLQDTIDSKLLLESLVHNVGVGILVQGPGAEIILNNAAALEMLDFTQDQLLGKTSFDADWKVVRKDGSAFPGEEHPVPTAIKTLQPVKDVYMCVYRPTQKNWIWLLVDAIPVFTSAGNLQYVICSFKDISELVRKEQELQQNHEMLNKLSNQLPGAIFQLRASASNEFNFQYCSCGINTLIGLNPEDLTADANRFFSLIDQEDFPLFISAINNSCYRISPFVFEFRMNINGRGTRWFSINSNPEKLGEGILLFNGYFADITERKNTEKEIAQTTSRFNYATQATSDGIYEWDIVEDKTYWSDGYKRMFEFEEDNNVGDYSFWYNKLDEGSRERVLDSLHTAINSNAEKWTEEYKYKKGNGEIVDVIDTAIIVRDQFGKAFKIVGALKDISLQKQAEKQLRLFESVIQNATDVIIISESSSKAGEGPRVIYVNDAFEKQTGFANHEIIGKTPRILQGVETLETTRKCIQSNLQNWLPVNEDVINYKKSGEKFWNRLFISPVADESGRFTHWVSIQRDVTKEKEDEIAKTKMQEEKIALMAIEKSERRYSQLVDSISEIMFTTDAVGNWTFLNKSWEKVMEYTVEESLAVPFFSFLHKDDVEKNAALFVPLIERKKTYCMHNIRYVSKSGSIKWMEVYAVLIINERDEIVGTSGTLKDITSEKRNEYYYELLSNNVKDLICVHDTSGAFLYASPSASEVVGYDANEMLEKFVTEMIHPDDLHILQDIYAEFMQRTADSYSKEFIARYKRKDGSYTWLEQTINLFFDGYSYEYKIVSTSKVIDKRIENEMQIHLSLEKEKRLNELKSRFISTASHEFKTPLTVIKSTIEVLRLYIEMDKPAINLTESLLVINSEVDDLSELLNDILILEKLELKKTTFEAECVDIMAWLLNLIGKFSTGLNETRKPELVCFSEKRNIYVDVKLMDKVITNLLSNAFKYSVGKPNPIVEVSFLENEVTIAVKDFGIGIPKADIDQLFDSFYRAKNVGNIEGTGLGLSIVKNFVQMHNGFIEVFSTLNEGSKFVIHLPR